MFGGVVCTSEEHLELQSVKEEQDMQREERLLKEEQRNRGQEDNLLMERSTW